MLEKLFTSKTRVKILTLFTMNLDCEFYMREISREIDENINSVRRELNNLEELNLLKTKKLGNSKYYKLNQKFPIYDEITSIFIKSEGVTKLLKEGLATVSGIEIAFIYGSFPEKKARLDSDIDMFIIGNPDEDELISTFYKISEKIEREIDYILFTIKEVVGKAKEENPFIKNVLGREKIVVVGDLEKIIGD